LLFIFISFDLRHNWVKYLVNLQGGRFGIDDNQLKVSLGREGWVLQIHVCIKSFLWIGKMYIIPCRLLRY